MSTKVLLITGATGKQGGAVVDALLASPTNPPDFTILGVTRDANSASAKKLASKSAAIRLLQGNLDDVPGLFRTASEITKQPIWGVFSVQVPMGKGQSVESEERQGKALVDESVKQGVKHFVYSSVDRGGDERSWVNPTEVPHFISKHRVELHLRDAAAGMQGEKMGWTVLRPVAFMDNFQPGFGSKVFMTALRDTLGEKPLQFVAVSDIGFFAAQAFRKPEQWNGKAIGLAGDDLNFAGLNKAFQNHTGAPAGTTFSFLGGALLWGVKEIGTMMSWFKTEGYGADIQGLKKLNPALMDFETWLDKESGFPKNK